MFRATDTTGCRLGYRKECRVSREAKVAYPLAGNQVEISAKSATFYAVSHRKTIVQSVEGEALCLCCDDGANDIGAVFDNSAEYRK